MKSQSENPAQGFDHTLIPQIEVQGRVRKLQTLLQETDLGGLLIVNRINLLYFSGTAQNGFLYVPSAGRPLLLIKRYLPRARRESGIPDVLEIRSTRDLPQVLTGFYGRLPAALGMEGDVLPQREFDFFRSLFPAERWRDGSALIRRARRVKTAWEIGCLEQAADRSAETLAFAAGMLAEGMSGPSLAAEAEIFARRLGHGPRIRLREDLAHFCHTPAPARDGGAVRWPMALGFRFVLQGYHMEETRLFAPGGFAAPLRSACADLAEIHDFLLERVKPGLAVAELCRHAGEKARSLGHGERFLHPSAERAAILGHGVGLELVEEPLVGAQCRAVFEAGMVIALEPRLALDRELTLTLGSVCLVTPSGCRRLSRVPVGVRPC